MLNKKALAAAVGVPAQYQIERSLRFNSADSAYLSRTPASAGNRKTWTWSGWVKRSALGTDQGLFARSDSSGNTHTGFMFVSDNTFRLFSDNSIVDLITSQVFRDVSSWYHIVVALDTTQATASNRAKIYVNGSQITAFSTATYPAQNTDLQINTSNPHGLGSYHQFSSGWYFNGYMANIDFVDGQALTPSSFGETDADTGVWKPKAFSGTYGTNGFYLDFSDNSGTTSTTLGKDYSGNSNNWTPNNFSVTAGVGNDSLVDTPTPYGTDTGAGGEVRGNYGTLNPTGSNSSFTFTNGNLDVSYNVSNSFATRGYGSFAAPSGKWYFEATITAVDSGALMTVGVGNPTGPTTANPTNSTGYNDVSYRADGAVLVEGVSTSYSSYTTNDVIGIAVDVDSGKVWVAKNNTWQNSGAPASGTGSIASGLTGSFAALFRPLNGSMSFNFGQRPFAYTAPSGFKALCTTNLATPAIGATSSTQANDYFDTGLYTGNGSATSRAISGPPNPDFVWIKSRSGAASHALYDVNRGFGKRLYSNGTDAEYDYGSTLLTPTSTGFNLTTADADHNTNNTTYAAWQWKGGGTGVSNTAGTITSTVSANTTAGFSIVTYTGNGTNGATVGHGLGVKPGMFIVKRRDSSPSGWFVYHTSLDFGTSASSGYVQLNTDAGKESSDDQTVFGDGSTFISPTSTVFTLGNFTNVNGNNGTFVAYCFAPVAGFSAFGSYTGNGSTDGPFVYTGFRPAYILLKNSSSSGYNWDVIDNKRNTYNVVDNHLFPDTSGAEQTLATNQIDFVSNGFKNRTGNFLNVNGQTYVYAAFAENPFKYSLAR
jgi:hypothetical protein